MRRTILLALLLTGLSQAQPKVAMVLKVTGAARNNGSPVVTGQMWNSGDHIELPAGSSLTLLLLRKGERVEVSGQGSLDVSAEGLALQGGSRSKSLPSNQMRLALNGENHRQIGGLTLRSKEPAVFNSALDRVEVSSEGITLSRPSSSGTPPRLKFFYLDQFQGPLLAADGTTVKLAVSGVPDQSVFAGEAAGQKVGSRWQWQFPWPLEDAPKNYALQVVLASSNGLQLYTRVYHPSAPELSELVEARQQAAQWARREPGTVGPWVFLANLLEEKGLLGQSLVALEHGLAVQPRDPGLLQMKARLLMDLGRYRQAAQVLQALPK